MKDALRQSVRPIVSARPNRTGPARRNDAAETRHAALQSMMNTAPTVQRLAALQRVANGGKSVADTSLQRIEDEEDLLQGKMMQRQSDEEDLLQGKMIQRQEEDDDLLQGKVIQREAMDDADPLQGKALQRRETGGSGGLPGPLRAGIEQLSGLSMEGVRVHRNSTAPAVVGAHAYAQGRDIHLGPGQEQHLPHEAWHVVQQAQGRVRATIQAKGVAINDDAGLEKEADLMGLAASHLATLEADPSPRSGRANTQVPGTVPTPFVRATPSLAKSRTARPSLFLQPASRSVLSTGTVQKQDKVINYGSGTSPETLMQSENEHVPDIDVTNVDTGHMLLAEIIQLNLVNDKREGIGGILDDLLIIILRRVNRMPVGKIR